jgi:hypothetical protein
MHTATDIERDGQRTQVRPHPLDYVLRCAACDYDCYYHGRYIGSRATLAKAIAAVEDEQAKAARHPLLSPATDDSIGAYQDELAAIAARLHDLAGQLASYPAAHRSMRAQLVMAHIRITQAIKNVQDAERSCALAQRTLDLAALLDVAG